MSILEDRLRAALEKYAREADRAPASEALPSVRRPLIRAAVAALVGPRLRRRGGGRALWIASQRGPESGPVGPVTGPTPTPTLSPEPTPTPSPAPGPCADKETIRADVDGDGRDDFVYHEFVQGEDFGEARLGVCTATGVADEIPGSGMTELLLITDVEPD